MSRKAQQQKANVKNRKAKQRAIAAKEHRSYIDRDRTPRRQPSFGAGSGLARLLGTSLIEKPSQESRDAQERMLVRMFGEDYRP